MDLKVCERCKKMFQSAIDLSLCPNCKEVEDKELVSIKKYLKTHENATLAEVADALDIEREHIIHLEKEKFLEPDSTIAPAFCSSCHIPIIQGSMCADCRKKILKGL